MKCEGRDTYCYIIIGNAVEPTPTARPKYSIRGGFSASSFSRLGLPTSLILPLVGAANHSLAATSWGSYSTAEAHVRRVEKYSGIKLVFPFSLKSTLAYVGFLLAPKTEGGREIQGKSVEKYLSAIRLLHMQKGHFSPWIRPEVVKQITRGASNRDQLLKRMQAKTGRLAMTPDLMRRLKINLREAAMIRSRKRLIWAVSTVSWAGALRVHELLARNTDTYDPLTTLLAADITVCQVVTADRVTQALKIHLKHPKEERLSAGVIIDVFATNDFMCPVKAYMDWRRDKCVTLTSHRPLFRVTGGRNYTGAMFNVDLRKLMGEETDYSKSPITSHSFRAGIATFMAKVGYSDEEIMAIGRWHSRAFLTYIKAPREVRARMAEELARKVAQNLVLQ